MRLLVLIPDQQTLCIGTNIFNSGQLQIRERAITKWQTITR